MHAIGGIIGGLATGFFATDQVGTPFSYGDNAGVPLKGVYYSGLKAGGHQLAVQIVGICFAIGWSFAGTYVILQAIDNTIGLRVSVIEEEAGLDSSIHGEQIGPHSKQVIPELLSDKEKEFERDQVGVEGGINSIA